MYVKQDRIGAMVRVDILENMHSELEVLAIEYKRYSDNRV